MTTQTLEAPATAEISPEQLDEFFARQHGIDAAVRRKAARTQNAGDVMILETYNLFGIRFEAQRDRIAGVDARLKTAGTEKERDAAQKQADESAEKFQAAESTLLPKIDDLERKLVIARQQLRTAKDEKTAAEAVIEKMDVSRRMLRDKLLPASFQEMLNAMSRPVRDRFRDQLGAARQKVSTLTSRANSGIGGAPDRGAVTAAEQELKALEAQQEAAILEIGSEIRNFYLCD